MIVELVDLGKRYSLVEGTAKMRLNPNSNLPLLLKGIRKYQCLTQAQVAKVLSLEQSSYSRVETGSQKLTAEQWFQFCELTGTPPDAAFCGYVDLLRPIGRQDQEFYSLPERYALEKGTSIRTILPLVEYARHEWGNRKWADYLRHVKIKPDFFLYLDHGIHLNFELDLAKELISEGKLKPKSLSEIVDPFSNPAFHGQLRYHYRNLSHPGERLRQLLSNQKSYGTNFNYSVMETSHRSLNIAGTPSVQLVSFSEKKEDILHDYLCSYRKNFLRSFAEGRGLNNRVQVLERGCYFKGASQCTYQFNF